MSKGIATYPENMRQHVIDRRMRAYNPKGPNGIGTLAAKAAYDKRLAKQYNEALERVQPKKGKRKKGATDEEANS